MKHSEMRNRMKTLKALFSKDYLHLAQKRVGGLGIDICLFTTHGILLTPAPLYLVKRGAD